MKRCKHKNGIFLEISDATHIRYVDNGTLEKEGSNSIDNIQRYIYRCEDCQKSFKYQWSTSPIWFQKIYKQLKDV